MLGKNLNQEYQQELNPQTECLLEELGIPVCSLTEAQENREAEIGYAEFTRKSIKLIAKIFAKVLRK